MMLLSPLRVSRVSRVVPVVLVVVVVLSFFGASVASAKTGVAASRFESPPEGFGVPVGVGVDGSLSSSRGHVYVSDLGKETVGVFSASGVWESAVSIPGIGPFELSVDDYPGVGEGDVYVAGLSAGVVLRFTPGLASKTEAIKGLAEPKDAVVDDAGDIFVVENAGNEGAGKVLEFNQAGEPVNPAGTVSASNTVAENLNAPQSLAVNALGTELYVATNGGGTLKYTLSGGAYAAASEPFDPSGSLGVSFGGAGDIFIGQSSNVAQYEPDGTLLSTFAEGALSGGFGVSVNSESGDVYVADAAGGTVFLLEPGPLPEEPTAQPATLKGAEATLNGTLNGGGSEYHFVYNAGTSCQGGPTTPVGKASSGAVSAQITGLLALTQYTFCLVATDKYGSSASPGVELTTGSVPVTVGGEAASEVSARSARLSGTVNINNNTGGSYYYEYGTLAAFEAGEEQKTAETSLPQSNSPAPTSVQIAGLAASVEYRFQLIAKNTSGETTNGTSATFNTLPAGSTTLPDHRVYEMVTPPGNQNANVYIPEATLYSFAEGIRTQALFQVAVNGSAVAYIADPTIDGYGLGGNGAGNQYLATRSPTSVWANNSIQVPGSLAGASYQGFSSDLSVGIINAGSPGEPDVPPLSPQAPSGGYSVLYACADSEHECLVYGEGSPVPGDPYRPLYSKPLDRSPGEFGTYEVFNVGRNEERHAVFAGGSAGFGDLLLEANDALLPGEGLLERELREDVKAEVIAREDHNYLYDSVEGHLELVDVLPDGRVAGDATFGALPVGEARHNPPDFSGVISSDGSRVYWTALSGSAPKGQGQVYVREGGSVTVPVSAGVARYWSSAEDGRFAFYTEAGGLYRFNTVTDSREALAASSAGVVGVLGSSEDGSYVYFAADGALATGASAQTCAGGGSCNLYVWHEGVSKLVAVLSGKDGDEVDPFRELSINEAEFGDWQPGLGQRTAEVGVGGDLVFMSDRSLGVVGFPGGFPNRGLDEVYLFDVGSGRLFCLSCSSSGEAPPAGEEGAAAFLPVSWDDTYHAQWMSEGGDRVFFDSAVPLVPQDANGKQDVYEWEREGTGSCTPGSGANGGCVYLLSGGTSKQDSWFIGASASGDDAFIVTRAQLVPQDRNEAFDLYDARVGGVEPIGEPACTGTDCQGTPAAAPTFATPPSVTYNGVGNFPPPAPTTHVKTKAKSLTRAQKLAGALKACRKQPKKKRAVCEAQMRRHYGGSLHKSSGGKK